VPTAEFVSPLAPAPIPAPGSSEPKKVHTNASRGASAGIVDALVALGVLKLEKPKQPLGILADLVLQTHGGADAKMGGWRVGPYGAGHKCYR
jgi:hypothetical protein